MITEQEFERLIPDKGIREYITTGIDRDNMLAEVLDFVPLYQNIINLAFIYAFSCYLDLKNNSQDGLSLNLEEAEKKANANSQRVLRTMQHIYGRYPLSSDLIQFVLADIYYDFIQGDNACLKPFFPECMMPGDYWFGKGIGLNDYFTFINENIESSRVEKDPLGNPFTLDSAGHYLQRLIEFFPFLGTTSLQYDETVGWYVFVVQNYRGKMFRNGIIDTFDLVRKFGNKSPYFCFLSKIETDTLRYETPRMNKFIVCPMVGVSGTGSFTSDGSSLKKPFEIPTDYETVMSYFSSEGYKSGAKKNDFGASIEQLFNINYKYMKNLALAIADVIGKRHYHHVGARLKNTFERKYVHAFENYNSQETKNWDSIIIILLIEAGPTAVLQEIFYALNDIGDEEVLKNIKRRFSGMLSGPITEINDENDFTKMAIERLGDRYIKSATGEELIRYNTELIAKAKTRIILSAIASAEQNDQSGNQNDCYHTDNIWQHIILLEASRNSTAAEKCKLVEYALGDTLRRLICFYKGVFKYGKEKIRYDNATRRKLLKPAEIKQYQENAENAFLEEARLSFEELKDVTSAVGLIQRFIQLCDDCCSSEVSVARQRSTESRQLYAVLGKNYIMDKTSFEKIVDLKTVSDINCENIDWWLDTAIRILQFLSTGVLAKNSPQSCSYHAIAPMVASYNNHNDSKDGYDTATFALIFDANELNGKGMEINMLSEFYYEISMRYYCLPNIVRSNNKWWIDPFVIKCADFDSIFMER